VAESTSKPDAFGGVASLPVHCGVSNPWIVAGGCGISVGLYTTTGTDVPVRMIRPLPSMNAGVIL
jgi:hypothetical protein